MDDVNVGLLRPNNELCGLTLDDLVTLYKKKLREDLDCYFCLQDDEFTDEVYNWIVEAPMDEWVLRLVFIKYWDNPYALWGDWRGLYEKIKTNSKVAPKSEEEAAKEMKNEAKKAADFIYARNEASHAPRVAANTVENHTNILRRMARRLFCR